MKLSELKHNHSLTDLLKVCLFSTLMLAPFISIAVRSLYVICNKNANQSYTSASVEMRSENYTLQEGIQYYYGYTGNTTGQTNNTTIEIEINTISLELNTNTKYIRFNNAGKINEYDSNHTLLQQTECEYCTYSVKTTNTMVQQPWYKNYVVVYTEQKLDNVFNYSVEKLANDSLFNWTRQTAVFNGIQAMTNNLGINYPAIPVILAYWFLLTVIYVIIDIIIKSFTLLTHMIGSKKA